MRLWPPQASQRNGGLLAHEHGMIHTLYIELLTSSCASSPPLRCVACARQSLMVERNDEIPSEQTRGEKTAKGIHEWVTNENSTETEYEWFPIPISLYYVYVFLRCAVKLWNQLVCNPKADVTLENCMPTQTSTVLSKRKTKWSLQDFSTHVHWVQQVCSCSDHFVSADCVNRGTPKYFSSPNIFAISEVSFIPYCNMK